jgi:hypothetical protein
MKMTITIEEADLREYINNMLAENGLKPRNTDYVFDAERKTYVIECDPTPIPAKESCAVPESGVDQQNPPETTNDESNDPLESETNNDDETESTMSLDQLRSASADIAARGPQKSGGVHPAARAHAKLAAVQPSMPMDGESSDPPVGGR